MNDTRRLRRTIERAIVRALAKMEDEADRPMHTFRAGEINGWKGDALASYVTPVVLRALNRQSAGKTKRKVAP